jgi:hypothetical protein
MIIRMLSLSPSSLAAFTAGVAQSGFGHHRAVQGIRAVSPQQPQASSPAAPLATAPTGPGGGVAPNQPLPRGSLLDLSV